MSEPFFITWSKQSGAPTLPVERAEHDEFILQNGQRVYDFSSTSFQSNFGHSQASILASIRQQLDEMPIASPKAVFELKRSVTHRLLRFLSDGKEPTHGKIFYTVSGAEAVENALKISRHITGRKVVLARRRSYHGASLGAMSVSGDWRSQPHLNFSEGTVRIPEPNDDPDGSITRQVIVDTGPETIAAVIVESISGVNGVVIPPQSWWDAMRELCTEHGILFIVDEVLAGFGRTGRNFGFHHFDIQPDLVTMSKGISGGYVPFGAVWVNDAIAARYDEEVLACGLTSYAHPLGLAALDGVLQWLETETDHKRELEQVFADCLNRWSEHPQVEEVRSAGLLAGIDLRVPPPSWQTLIDQGLYVVAKENMLVLAPPFVSTPERLRAAFATLETCVLSEHRSQVS